MIAPPHEGKNAVLPAILVPTKERLCRRLRAMGWKLGLTASSCALFMSVSVGVGVAGAGSEVEVVTGRFSEFSSGVDRGYDIKGPVRLKRGSDWTMVRVNVKGLDPLSTYASHLHENACSDEFGGGHYMDDPAGPPTPPNELWLELETNRRGIARDSSTASWAVRDGARSVVIHDSDGARIACADLFVD